MYTPTISGIFLTAGMGGIPKVEKIFNESRGLFSSGLAKILKFLCANFKTRGRGGGD